MQTERRQTIFALASAPGKAGVAVVRLSGPMAIHCIKYLTYKDNLKPRMAHFCTFRNPAGALIDHGLALWFQGPHSFTGEDVAEFHVHGGRAVVEALCDALHSFEGVRPAEPGEFTRRAVENGKLDLTRAEAIADLIDAETDAQHRQALAQYEGNLARLIGGWREALLHGLAQIEAVIDFADEEVPEESETEGRAAAATCRRAMERLLSDRRRGELIREGLNVAVVGPPNAGKSALVNALARRDVAIVSPVPGTTRDVIEVRLNLDGYAVVLADTAGIRAPLEPIEAEGVRRARERADKSDMVLLVRDGTAPRGGPDLSEFDKPCLEIWNKVDLPWPVQCEGLKVSALTGEGLNDLVAHIAEKAKQFLGGDGVPITRQRHRQAIAEAADALARAETAQDAELFAEDVRLALRALGRISGQVDVEEVLELVFKDFCIGK